jgi:tetratricopeptide (TPR) repeat protein
VIQLLLLGFALPVAAGVAPKTCVPPATLQAKLRARPDAETYSELGTWYGDRQQHGCAADAFRSALKLQSGSAKLSFLLGLSLYSAGKPDEAIAPLQQSVETAPEVLAPRLILAAALEQLQRKPEARVQWGAALKIDPHSATALDGMSKSLLGETKFVEVLRLLRPATLDKNLTADLAEAYLGLKLFDEAAKTIHDGLRKTPSSLQLQTLLIRLAIQQFHYQEAERLAEKTAGEHPSDLATQRLYLRSLVLSGNTAAARALVRKLLQQEPGDFDFLYLSGVMEHDAGDSQAARAHLEKAVAVNPNAAAAHFNLGLVLAQMNDPNSAKAHLERALELGATEPEVHLQLGKVLHSLGENQQATEQLRLYRQGLEDQHNKALAASKAGQGDKEMAAGDPGKAVTLYREALAATPNDAQVTFKLAVALDKTGDTAGEREALEKAIQINPDLAEAQNQMGFLASQSGDTSGAEKHFRAAVRAAPGFTEAWVNLAATLGLQSRFSEAQEAVSSALELDPTNPQALLLRDTLAKVRAQR